MRFINIKAEVDPVDYKPLAFPYKGVVFDMDGVLVDTGYLEQRHLEEYAIDSGLDVSDGERMAFVGSSGRFMAPSFAGGTEPAFRSISRAPGLRTPPTSRASTRTITNRS